MQSKHKKRFNDVRRLLTLDLSLDTAPSSRSTLPVCLGSSRALHWSSYLNRIDTMTQPGALNALDSTALHQSVPAPPLPLLPIELYTYIIQLALPPPAYHSIPQRNAVLRSWALVHSTWAACIRCELWRDLYLPNTSRGRDVHYWLINQAIDRDPACAAIVETLWVHFADPDPEGLQTTWELVQRFNNLKNVNARSQNWRSGFKWFELARTAPRESPQKSSLARTSKADLDPVQNSRA